MYQDLLDKLTFELIIAEESSKIQFSDSYNLPFKGELGKETEYWRSSLIEFYKLYNGFKVTWSTDEKMMIGGNIEFPKLEDVLTDKPFDKEQIKENNDLLLFYPFDMNTPEIRNGLLFSEDLDDEVYSIFHTSSELHGLNLDFEGYFRMLYETKGYYNWTKIILDLSEEKKTKEVMFFKKNMPKLFTNFDWNTFINIYQSLKLVK